MNLAEEVRLAVENIGQRVRLNAQGLGRHGVRGWYWRLCGALWLDSWRGPASLAARRIAVPETWHEMDLIYGETPLSTAVELLDLAEFPPGGTVIEIGAGRAVFSLVACLTRGARATAIERVPGLVARASWLARALQVPVECVEADAGSLQLDAADLYYLTPTSWTPANFDMVKRALQAAPPGARALSLTEPLGDGWAVQKEREFLYSWGWSRTYLQLRT